MQKVNPTVLAVTIIIAVTVILALLIIRTDTANPVTSTSEETEASPLPPNEGPEPVPEEPIIEIEPDSPEEPTDPVACTMDAKECPDGSFVGRIPPSCEFADCPPVEEEPIECTKDVQECPDGSFVSRIAPSCDFADCPPYEEPVACTQDVKECPDGSYVGRTPPSCEFATCPTPSPNMQLQF
jgi:uncharacterized protein (UPF0179 family)